MPSKGPRPLPNNARACVEDIIAILHDTWPVLRSARDQARNRYMDPALTLDLADLTEALAGIEHHAKNALKGQYEERRR